MAKTRECNTNNGARLQSRQKNKSNTRNSTSSNKTCRTKKKQNVLPAAHSVSRESRQQADSTADFILAARGLPLVHPGLIYVPSAAEGQRSWRWLGGRDAWQLHPHQPSACRSSCPSGSGRGRQGGRHSGRGKWPTVLRVLAVWNGWEIV